MELCLFTCVSASSPGLISCPSRLSTSCAPVPTWRPHFERAWLTFDLIHPNMAPSFRESRTHLWPHSSHPLTFDLTLLTEHVPTWRPVFEKSLTHLWLHSSQHGAQTSGAPDSPLTSLIPTFDLWPHSFDLTHINMAPSLRESLTQFWLHTSQHGDQTSREPDSPLTSLIPTFDLTRLTSYQHGAQSSREPDSPLISLVPNFDCSPHSSEHGAQSSRKHIPTSLNYPNMTPRSWEIRFTSDLLIRSDVINASPRHKWYRALYR